MKMGDRIVYVVEWRYRRKGSKWRARWVHLNSRRAREEASWFSGDPKREHRVVRYSPVKP